MKQVKKFLLNNEKYVTNSNISLYDLIKYFDYNESLLVLEYNQVIFNKTYWKNTFIQDLDEIVFSSYF